MPDDPAHASRALFCQNYTFADDSQFFDKALHWAKKHADSLLPDQPPILRKKRVGGRIGLGFISADYTRHPVGKLFLPSSNVLIVIFSTSTASQTLILKTI